MKLKLSQIASLAEIVGAFAVEASLIYVGIQVDDSNRAVRSASINDANVLGFQNSYLMAEEGTVDSELVNGLTSAILTVKDTPGFKRYWRQRRTLLHPRFVRYVEELVQRADSSGRQESEPAAGSLGILLKNSDVKRAILAVTS